MKKLLARQYSEILVNAVHGHASDRERILRDFVAMIAARRAWKLVPRIVQHVERLEDQRAGQTKVEVWQAGETVQNIAEQLSDILGTIRLETHKDPSLIGGLRLKIGDTLVDASLTRQLKRLHTQLTNA